MLIRGIRQLVALIGPLILITSTICMIKWLDGGSIGFPKLIHEWGEVDGAHSHGGVLPEHEHLSGLNDDEFDLTIYGKAVHEVKSLTTRRGKYFDITFGEYTGYNPNILPHPQKEDTWIVIAQMQRTETWNTVWFAQLICEAQFIKGKLSCLKSAQIVPIAVSSAKEGTCTGDLAFLGFNVGPHDARAFYGPQHPYIVWGAQSIHNCFGQWIQDLRIASDWGAIASNQYDPENPFRLATELQRPPPVAPMEKNWFMFWDSMGQMYAHYDISPRRSFAQIAPDGSAGLDLAPMAADQDEKCMAKFMPKLAPQLESIHQATNSLSVTLCKRSDPNCHPNDENTFIMTIFQWKSYYYFHGIYEPYVMLFKRNAPFNVHGISTKPIWLHGRTKAPKPKGWDDSNEWTDTEMIYMTSITWKNRNQTYHGYLDDVMFLGFGIEDKRAAAIDVLAGDVLEHMGLCSEVKDAVTPSTTQPAAPHVDLSSLDFNSVVTSAGNEIVGDSNVLGSHPSR